MQNTTTVRVFREIPASIRTNTSSNAIALQKKLRVAAYGRVSTDNEEQQSSYNAQVEHYTNYIKNNPQWEFVEMYADEGITGTSMRKRKDFLRMIEDARAGKIDMIITKSISRFARNTVECLQTVRELRDINVKVYFEKENLDSMDTTGNLMLSILSSIAEEESRSISTNNKWRIQKTFEKGEVIVGRGLYGYTITDKNKYEIDPEKAMVVRRIYEEFIKGKSITRICRDFTKEGILSPTGKTKWTTSTIYAFLQNEKFVGDAKLQKTFKQDVLSKIKQNNGEVKMYYISNNHVPIIDRETYATAQLELEKRAKRKDGSIGSGKYSSCYAFSRKLRCRECGSLYRRGQQRSRGNIKYCWLCINHADIKECSALPVQERYIEDAFLTTLHEVIDNKNKLMNEIKQDIQKAVEATKDLNYDKILATLSEKQSKILALNKSILQGKNKQEDEKKIIALMNEVDTLNSQLKLCEEAQTNMLSIKQRLNEIETVLTKKNGFMEFIPEIFKSLIDEVLVDKNQLTFQFKCGIEVTQEI